MGLSVKKVYDIKKIQGAIPKIMSLEETLNIGKYSTVVVLNLDDMDRSYLKELIREVLSEELEPKMKAIMSMLFDLEEDGRLYSFKEITEKLGITRAQLYNMREKGLKILEKNEKIEKLRYLF